MMAAATLTAQNVGVGTTNPHATALLHVDAGSSLNNGLLITGTSSTYATMPDLGAGSRLMFYPGKSAFRAGYSTDNRWDNSNIGLFSVGMGNGTMASGSNSVAIGLLTKASGSNSTAMGYNTNASGSNSTAMGNTTTASGTNSTAMGVASIATQNAATAMGYQTTADGAYSTAFGYLTTASGLASTAIGNKTIAKAAGSVAFGQYNDVTDAPLSNSEVSTDRIFQIGNGNSIARSNALTVLRNGNVGIGVLAPTASLQVRSASIFAAPQLNLQVTADGYSRLRMNNTVNPTPWWDIAGLTHASTSGSAFMNFYYSQNGTTGVDVLSLRGNGNAAFAGTVTANGVTLTSDERLKKDITPLDDVMPQLAQLSGYQYHWKDESRDATLQTGLLAQEVEKVLPQLVTTDEHGMKSVNYNGLIPYLLEAVKAQQSTIAGQQQQIEGLKKIVEQLVAK
jgi:hypothetical protein